MIQTQNQKKKKKELKNLEHTFHLQPSRQTNEPKKVSYQIPGVRRSGSRPSNNPYV